MIDSALLFDVVALAKKAGNKILEYYAQAKVLHIKADASPITQADLAAHFIINEGLQQLIPQYPVLSEESEAIDFAERQKWSRYWLVDPLDGTKEFLEKTDDFTVNIALIDDHVPVLGVLYAPALKIIYFAAVGQGAFKQAGEEKAARIQVKPTQTDAIRVVGSRRHGLEKLEKLLDRWKKRTVSHRGSALKFGLVAEGVADVYPRMGPTSEWDTAAGQCIVEEAGGAVVDFNGTSLRYNTQDSLENPEFLVLADRAFLSEK